MNTNKWHDEETDTWDEVEWDDSEPLPHYPAMYPGRLVGLLNIRIGDLAIRHMPHLSGTGTKIQFASEPYYVDLGAIRGFKVDVCLYELPGYPVVSWWTEDMGIAAYESGVWNTNWTERVED